MVQKLIVATDGSDNARRAEATASEIAAGVGADILLVHVVASEPRDPDLTGMAGVMSELGPQRNASMHAETLADQVSQATGEPDVHTNADALRVIGERLLEQGAARARDVGVADVDTHLQFGDPGAGIVDAAEANGADMIVVGTRGFGGLRGRLMGSVSQHVIDHAEQSTLVVKG